MRALALTLLTLCILVAAPRLPAAARFVLARVLSLNQTTGTAELAVSGHGLAPGARSYVLTEARQGLEVEILSVDVSSTEVRFLGDVRGRIKEGDRLTLYCGETTPATPTTTPDHLPLPGPRVAPATRQIAAGTSELELFLQQQQLELDLLKADMLMAELGAATAEEQPRGWSWRGQARAGVEHQHDIDYTPLGIDTSDPQQALDDLDQRIAEAAPIVEQSGSEDARDLLDQAVELRNEAATYLSTDPELALLLIQTAAFTVDEALRAAGAAVPPQTSRRKVDDDDNFFVENVLFGERRTAGGGRMTLDNRLRSTDRYRRGQLSLGLASAPGSFLGWGLRPQVDWYNYEPGSSDDSLSLRLDGELFRDFLSRDQLRLTAGERLFYRREYNGNGDDGYRTAKGFLEARYRLDDFTSTALRYTATAQRYNREVNAEFDYDGHELAWGLERFGLGSTSMLEAALEQRDYAKPADEDDFLEARLTARLTHVLAGPLSLFSDSTLARRLYRETGSDNSDYNQLEGRAGIEWRASRALFALEAGLAAVRYDPESPLGLPKEKGNFNEERYQSRFSTGPWRGWGLEVSGGYERRHYLSGETGQFETWLSADFSPLADFDRASCSFTLRKEFSRAASLALLGSHAREYYRSYSEYNTLRELLGLQLTVRY